MLDLSYRIYFPILKLKGSELALVMGATLATKRMVDRVEYVSSRDTERDGYDKLPAEALEALEKVVKQANK